LNCSTVSAITAVATLHESRTDELDPGLSNFSTLRSSLWECEYNAHDNGVACACPSGVTVLQQGDITIVKRTTQQTRAHCTPSMQPLKLQVGDHTARHPL